jgi:hypothetical protein
LCHSSSLFELNNTGGVSVRRSRRRDMTIIKCFRRWTSRKELQHGLGDVIHDFTGTRRAADEDRSSALIRRNHRGHSRLCTFAAARGIRQTTVIDRPSNLTLEATAAIPFRSVG